jgi:hypothetical protein
MCRLLGCKRVAIIGGHAIKRRLSYNDSMKQRSSQNEYKNAEQGE